MLVNQDIHTQVRQAALSELSTVFGGNLIFPDDPAYEMGRKVWNGMINRYPALIAQCAATVDVVTTVNFARRNGFRVAVRGGGHNVAGLATWDDAIVIDLSQMSDVNFDLQTETVWVGGGATWGDVDPITQVHGLAVPGGLVSETGVAGLTLGGGYGWLRNKYGLTCDNLIGAEVVTANGQIVTASENENFELLWALRGGGGNFGIVTRFHFQAHPVGPEVYFAFVFHNGEDLESGFRFYRDFSAAAPDEVGSVAFAGVFPPTEEIPEELHHQPFFAMAALYIGDIETGERVLKPIRDYSPPLMDMSSVMPYVDVQKILDEDYPSYTMRYYWKSLNLAGLDDPIIAKVAAQARLQPSPYSTTDLWHIGGAVKRFDHNHAAFNGRDSAFLLSPEANWIEAADDEANITWVREMVEALAAHSDGSRYLNFAGFQEEGDDMMKTSFGQNYTRLSQIKRKYDPDNFFSLNQNIKPAVV